MGKHKEQQARLKEYKIKDKLWEETQKRMESKGTWRGVGDRGANGFIILLNDMKFVLSFSTYFSLFIYVNWI